MDNKEFAKVAERLKGRLEKLRSETEDYVNGTELEMPLAEGLTELTQIIRFADTAYERGYKNGMAYQKRA